MPYIKPAERETLDPLIYALGEEAGGISYDTLDRAGRFNYCITTLALRMFPNRKYWILALVCGVFVTALLEYYRRWVGPYEDSKITEHGDVY